MMCGGLFCVQRKTALDLAEKGGHTEVANLLKGTSNGSIVTMWLVCCDALGLCVPGDEIIIYVCVHTWVCMYM